MKRLPAVILLAVLVLAAALRIPQLASRPMHADEAIQADRFGTLLETESFHYDPSEYHGPALAIFTLPSAWIGGAQNYRQLTEVIIRLVPAFFGLLLIAMSYLIGRAVANSRAGALAASYTAVSPGMAYYSRYYIPEVLLVFSTAALLYCIVRSSQAGRVRWAILGGASVGLMFAAKETAVLAFAAVALGCVALRPRVGARFVLTGSAAAIATTILFYGTGAAWESLRSLAIYATRAVDPPLHAQPWHYYSGVLLQSGDGIFALLALAAVPPFLARDRTVAFLFIYAIALTAIYSVLPYKTPWCVLSFVHAWILLAALGTARLMSSTNRKLARIAAAVLLVLLSGQAWRYSFTLASDPRNPYVYAHTLPDVYAIHDAVENLSRNHPDGKNIPIQIFTTENFWPLPWYLREYPRVLWWRAVPGDTAAAPLILLSPAMEDAVTSVIYERPPPGERELYVSLFEAPVWLRPGVEVRGYAALSLARK